MEASESTWYRVSFDWYTKLDLSKVDPYQLQMAVARGLDELAAESRFQDIVVQVSPSTVDNFDRSDSIDPTWTKATGSWTIGGVDT